MGIAVYNEGLYLTDLVSNSVEPQQSTSYLLALILWRYGDFLFIVSYIKSQGAPSTEVYLPKI